MPSNSVHHGLSAAVSTTTETGCWRDWGSVCVCLCSDTRLQAGLASEETSLERLEV